MNETDVNRDTEWWWIDYLENEMEVGLEKDLQLLLQHSQEDRDSFERFRILKEWLRDSDSVKGWPIEDRLVRVHKGVMQAIEQLEPLDQLDQRVMATKFLSV